MKIQATTSLSPSLLLFTVLTVVSLVASATDLLLAPSTATSTASRSISSSYVVVGVVVDAYAHNNGPKVSSSWTKSSSSSSSRTTLSRTTSIRGGQLQLPSLLSSSSSSPTSYSRKHLNRILLSSLMSSSQKDEANNGSDDDDDDDYYSGEVSPIAVRDSAPALPVIVDNSDVDSDAEGTISTPVSSVSDGDHLSSSSFSTRLRSSLGSFFNPTKNQFDSAMLLVVADVAFRRLFDTLKISFPSSLGGMMILLAAMLLKGGTVIYQLLAPGAGLLAKWLPVFFVPSLITLPLIDGSKIGGPVEIAKIMAVIVTGFLFTLLTTAGSVMKVGSASSSSSRTSIDVVATEESDSNDQDGKKTSVSSPSPSPKVFSDELLKQLRLLAIVSGVVALEAASPVFPFTLKIQLPKLETPLVNILLGSTTLASFAFGSRMSARFKKVVHPLVTCTLLTWGIMGLFAKCVEGGSFTKMLTTYKMGNGINGPFGTGAGDIFLFLLGPAVLSLSVSMYEKRQLIRDNAKEVATATAVSTLGGLFGTALMVRLARILSPDSRVALISRNITSPLAMAISKILGADASTVSLAVGMVVVTGLIGANFGASILSLFGIGERNSVARGMGIGAAAHGLGTAAFAGEKDAFPFAAISMALTATACTVLVSIPVIKKLVLAIALGGV